MKINWAKIAVFLVCLAPLGFLAWKGLNQFMFSREPGLGANPIEVITHSTGRWTLRLLLATLGITPLRKLTGWFGLIRFRRMIGLFAFFYACLHFLTYIWLDKFFDLHDMMKDIGKRPFITIGFAAFILLIPLAVTSTRGMIQRLGGRRWAMLHRLIYVSAIAGILHFQWAMKKDIREPLEYAAVLALLLGYRAVAWFLRRVSARRPARAPQTI